MATMASSNKPSSTNTFNLLPIELNQNIARCIDDDKDIGSFRLVCHATDNAVDSDGFSFWRHRFLNQFDAPSLGYTGGRNVNSAEIRREYKERKETINVIHPDFQKVGKIEPKLRFHVGQGGKEKIALRVLRDLIIDAFSDKKGNDEVGYESKNMKYILNIVQKTNLLQIAGKDARSNKRHAEVSFLYAVQCILAPAFLSFEDWHMGYNYNFDIAQRMAYADNVSLPIFAGASGLDINMSWLLKNLQFWRNHLLSVNEPLCPSFEALDDCDRPRFWDEQLSQDTSKLAKHWKGSYAFVNREEIAALRAGRNGQAGHRQIQDQLNGEEDPDEAFQGVQLGYVDPDKKQKPWPAAFERILKSKSMPINTPKTRAQKSGYAGQAIGDFSAGTKAFGGNGDDSDEMFKCEGFLNTLPPQHGIPGWKRMTMMKYYYDDQGHIDMQALWAYEGVMLPGGKIMVGRWWCPTDGVGANMYSGPFILWNVDDAVYDADEGCVAQSDTATDRSEESEAEVETGGKGKKASA